MRHSKSFIHPLLTLVQTCFSCFVDLDFFNLAFLLFLCTFESLLFAQSSRFFVVTSIVSTGLFMPYGCLPSSVSAHHAVVLDDSLVFVVLSVDYESRGCRVCAALGASCIVGRFLVIVNGGLEVEKI